MKFTADQIKFQSGYTRDGVAIYLDLPSKMGPGAGVRIRIDASPGQNITDELRKASAELAAWLREQGVVE